MTYHFSGVIAPGGDALCAKALAENFGGVWRTLVSPFPGFALAFASDYKSLNAPPAFEKALLSFTARFPATPFIRLQVECFGGTCVQSGSVFCNGEVIARVENDKGGAPSPLRQLAKRAGVAMASDVFPALERNWFQAAGDAEAGRDRTMMRIALALAAEGVGRTGENPVVGCVIADGEDGVLAEARTVDGGRPHAEEAALGDAGGRVRGATAYVTLEPCARRSAGGAACADLLIRAGIARAVIAARDPHPNAAGVGIERLRAAGVRVDIGLMEAEARAQNADFLARWEKG